MQINGIHTLITIVAGTVIAIMSLCLLLAGMPDDKTAVNYRISRRVLALGYALLSAACFLAVSIGLSHTADTDPMVKTMVLIVAAFQMMVLEFSTLVLINAMSSTLRRVIWSLVPITAVGLLLSWCFAFGGEMAYIAVFYTAWILYAVQITLYIRIFRREYSDYRIAMNNYFSDGKKHLKWIRTAYFLAIGLGISTGFSLFLSSLPFACFMVLAMAFYVYYAIRYIRYARTFAEIAPALEPLFEEVGGTELKDNIPGTIDDWITGKGFTRPGITLEQAAGEMGINRTILTIYINRRNGQTFSRWIAVLRIEEARELIISNPRIPLAEVGRTVGIRKRRAFFRSFLNVTGEDARDFRDRMLALGK